MSVYNVEKYLTKCLVSLILQTFTNTEEILINDETTDNSLNLGLKLVEDELLIVMTRLIYLLVIFLLQRHLIHNLT